MKQKTFELDRGLTEAFERFCRSRLLVEKRAAAAALLRFMSLDPQCREELVLRLDQLMKQAPQERESMPA